MRKIFRHLITRIRFGKISIAFLFACSYEYCCLKIISQVSKNRAQKFLTHRVTSKANNWMKKKIRFYKLFPLSRTGFVRIARERIKTIEKKTLTNDRPQSGSSLSAAGEFSLVGDKNKLKIPPWGSGRVLLSFYREKFSRNSNYAIRWHRIGNGYELSLWFADIRANRIWFDSIVLAEFRRHIDLITKLLHVVIHLIDRLENVLLNWFIGKVPKIIVVKWQL